MSTTHPTRRQRITPPTLAEHYGISVLKVLKWIRSGELRAIDVSTKQGGKPRYAIDPADVEVFEARRAVCPPIKTPRRKQAPADVTQYV